MDQPLATGPRPPARDRARSTPGGNGEGSVAALEPSEPSREAGARLRQAMAARAAIDHPNLLRAWAVGEAESRLFVVFEPCRHPSLAELLAAAPLEPADCARVLDGAAAGVDALSRRALVARDLTPERLLVDPGHGGVLMDLGIPPELLRPVPPERDPDLAFRSPEELRRQPVDVRSSVYSLGVILVTALTGVPPYAGKGSDVYSSHLAGAPPRTSERRPELLPEIDAVVARAMAPHPAERYANATALSRAFAAAVGGDLAPATLPTDLEPRQRPQQPSPKRPPRSPAQLHLPPASGPARRAAAGLLAAARRGVAMTAAFLLLAGALRSRGSAGLHRFVGAVGPIARGAAGVVAGARARRLPSVKSTVLSSLSRRTRVLQAIGAIAASALAGIVLGRAMEPDGAPTSITGAGMTVQLPPGWEQATSDRGRPAISSAIAAGPPEDANSRFVAGKVSSQAAAARILEGVQRGDEGRTLVQLGGLHAWRYTGLRPRPHLVGTGYLVPTTGGAVLVMCHSSQDDARIRLAECDRAATTLVVRGERLRGSSPVDPSRERLVRAIAALRSSRSEGRQRLVEAKLARGQARAATSLELGHERAARSIDRIAALEDGRSLANLSAALRAAADAYGRLAGAATIGSRSAYREASRAVIREEEAVSRELARASSA